MYSSKGRDVKNVASYVGFKEGGKYQIIDLSEDLEDYDYGGKLGNHFVNKDWKSWISAYHLPRIKRTPMHYIP